MTPLDRTVALQVFERDGWKCRHCGLRENLQAHHVIYKSRGGSDDLNNLLTLCAACHRGHHDKFLLIEVKGLLAVDLIVRFIRERNWRPQ